MFCMNYEWNKIEIKKIEKRNIERVSAIFLPDCLDWWKKKIKN